MPRQTPAPRRSRRTAPAPTPTPRRRRSRTTEPTAIEPEQFRPDAAPLPAPPEVVTELVNHQERAHARFSPSWFRNIAICPAYRGDDRRTDTSAADEGTRLHEFMERGTNPPDIEGLELVEACRAYVAEVRNQIAIDGLAILDEFDEVRLDLGNGIFGHVDKVFVVGADDGDVRGVHVFDWKFGRNQVEDAETNLQGYGYILGAWNRWTQADFATVHFVMPRIDVASSATFTQTADRLRMGREVSSIIDRASMPEPSETVDMANCQYCGRKATCIAFRRAAIEVASRVVPADPIIAQVIELGNLGTATPEGLSACMKVGRLIDGWYKAVRARALELRLTGVEIPGYELRERVGSQSITTGQVEQALITASGALTAEGLPAGVIAKLELALVQRIAVSPDLFDSAVEDVLARARVQDSAEVGRIRNIVRNSLQVAGLISQGESSQYLSEMRRSRRAS